MEEPDEILFNEDTIDSRDIQDRIDWLREEIDYLEEQLELADEYDHSGETELIGYREELDKLEAFKSEVESSEWEYGLVLINRDYWEEYVEGMVSEIGDLPKDLPDYISNNIDWSGVANDIEYDYSSIRVDGAEYLYRDC